jgi:Flp pilus assembly protein TadD
MSQLDETPISARLGELIADARFDEALRVLDHRLLLGPSDPWFYGMRALLLLETGDTQGALVASATAVAEAPMAAFAHWTRGLVLLRANIVTSALRAAERAVALDPEEPDTHVLLARVYLQNQQWDSARSAIADAAARGADDEELLPLRAAIAAGRGLNARAIDTWRIFAQRFPANALARTGHAWTLLEAGNVRDAREEFEQARALDPTNAWALEGLVVTQTHLLPIHRRWFTRLHNRVMANRESTMLLIGVLCAATGMLLLVSGRLGVVIPAIVTVIGAALPVFDAWRSKQIMK